MRDLNSSSNSWAVRTAKNTTRLGIWTVAWVVTLAVASFGSKWIWDFDTVPTILSVLVNLGVGIGMILAYRRHLQGLDEMHQKIFLDAGALTLGVGVVCGTSYEILEDIQLISFEPEISHLMILMSFTLMAGLIAGHRKYR